MLSIYVSKPIFLTYYPTLQGCHTNLYAGEDTHFKPSYPNTIPELKLVFEFRGQVESK